MHHSLTLAVAGILAAAGAAYAPPERSDKASAAKTEEGADQIVCRRIPVTGSLARTTRVCKTRADWERELANARATATSTTCRGGGGVC